MTGRLPRAKLVRLAELLRASEVRFDEPMSRHTSFMIGGPADAWVAVANREDLRTALDYCGEQGLPWLVLGRGTNVLVRDGGLRAVVLTLAGELAQVRRQAESVVAGAGVSLSQLAHECACAGLGGLEFAAGIPGSVGGAVVMNAGAYGGQVGDVVSSVTVTEPGRGWEQLPATELRFAYRYSALQEAPVVVVEVRLRLHPRPPEVVLATIEDLSARRRARQPLEFPSAGSAFKRPAGHYAAELIERAGLKGRRRGGAQVSPRHAGFIINTGGASARDVLELMDEVRAEVRARCGVELEPEIRVLGEDGP